MSPAFTVTVIALISIVFVLTIKVKLVQAEDYLTPSVAQSISHIAINAGRAIMEFYEMPEVCNVEVKSDASPLTQADLCANEIILSALRRFAPEIPVLSEESSWIGGNVATYWAVDPLDGTKEFLKHNGEFTVNIGLVVDGIARMGVIYAPALNTVWAGINTWKAEPSLCVIDARVHAFPRWACKSEADSSSQSPIEFFDWEPIGVSKDHKSSRSLRMQPPLRVLSSRSHPVSSAIFALQEEAFISTRSVGSSLKFCMIAEGKGDYYPRFGPTSIWDTVAGDAILSAAGGITLMLPDLKPLKYPAPLKSFLNPPFIATRSPSLLMKYLKL